MKIFFASLIALSALTAQNATNQPKFEVASVKRADGCFGGRSSIDPGSVTLRGVPLKAVLMEAFNVKMEQIEGPSWLETDCFEISAKIPDGATRDQLPAMLQALLAERFKLAAHKEDRPRSGYALIVDKGGPKFKEDDPKANFMGSHSGQLFVGAAGYGRLKGVMPMATLARSLSTRDTVRCKISPGSQETTMSISLGRRTLTSNRWEVALPFQRPRPKRGHARGAWSRPVCRPSGPAWIETGAPTDAGPIPGSRPHRADSD